MLKVESKVYIRWVFTNISCICRQTSGTSNICL